MRSSISGNNLQCEVDALALNFMNRTLAYLTLPVSLYFFFVSFERKELKFHFFVHSIFSDWMHMNGCTQPQTMWSNASRLMIRSHILKRLHSILKIDKMDHINFGA